VEVGWGDLHGKRRKPRRLAAVKVSESRRLQKMQGRPADVVMLGLSGFVVLGVAEIDGEFEVVIQTTGVRVGCPQCGVIAWAHGRHTGAGLRR
jgi:hypothetical protein